MTVGVRSRVVPIALVFLLATSLPPPVPSAPHASNTTWDGLPLGLRERIHMHVSELPPFPEHPHVLRDLRRWPQTRVFGGESYALVIAERGHDTERLVGSPDEIRPGHGYGASYMRVDSEGKRVKRGPSYFWRENGMVLEQGYRTEEETDVRTYDPRGRVMYFLHSSNARRRSWLSCANTRTQGAAEWFDSNGNLIGVRVSDREHYWKGVPKSMQQFYELRRAWDPWNAVRDSVRRAHASG
jgi:hypothetical protein